MALARGRAEAIFRACPAPRWPSIASSSASTLAEQRDDVGYLAWQIDRDGLLLWARDDAELRRACRDLSKLLPRARYPHETEPTEAEARAAAGLAAVVRRRARSIIRMP